MLLQLLEEKNCSRDTTTQVHCMPIAKLPNRIKFGNKVSVFRLEKKRNREFDRRHTEQPQEHRKIKNKGKNKGKIDTSITTEANKIDMIIISVTGVILRVTLAVLLFFCSLFFYRLVSNSKTYYTVNHSNTIERYSE